MMLSKRITENNRLEIAAAAIKRRMTRRRRPLVLRPVSPSKKELVFTTAMVELHFYHEPIVD